MKIINKDNVTDTQERTLFTVELDDNKYVDVMAVMGNGEKPFVYVMQNEDGSTVYDNEETCPDCVYKEKDVVDLIKNIL